MSLKYMLPLLVTMACNDPQNNEEPEQNTNGVMPQKREIRDSIFENKVIIILRRELQPQSHEINIQDYVKNGKSFIPVFTSIAKFNKSTSGQVNNPVKEIEGILLLSILHGNETLKINPGLPDEISFQADELIAQYAAAIDSLKIKTTRNH